MGKDLNITKDQLYFISFVSENVAFRPDLNDRLKRCLDALPSARDNKPKEIESGLHSPRKMIEFLSLFSKDDHFKWYTHKWDQNELTLENLISEQCRKKKDLFVFFDKVNKKTYYHIYNFINFEPKRDYQCQWFSNDGKKQTIGWHSVIELHKQAKDLPMENLKCKDGCLFKDYIDMFKSSIEFRTDLRPEDRFNRLIRDTVKRAVNGAVDFDFSDNFKKVGPDINIYCDINLLLYGIRKICDWIVKNKDNGNKVTVDLVAEPSYYELVIFHHNSYFNNEDKLVNPSGDFSALRDTFFSVCDFTMIGDLKKDGNMNGAVIVVGLSDTTMKTEGKLMPCEIEHRAECIGGVRYLIKLYRK